MAWPARAEPRDDAGGPTPGLAVEARGLRRSLGRHPAVDGLDLAVREGETLALLGPNGAGKSTTVALLTASLTPHAGRAFVAGHDVARAPGAVRARIGVVFQGPTLEPLFTVEENLRWHARLHRVPREAAEARMAALLERMGLAPRAGDLAARLSGGLQRRLELARALLARPRVLFLDEPTTGLDPPSRVAWWALLEEVRREEGLAVLLTTHHMEEAERLAHRVLIMDRGRAVAAGPVAELKASLGRERVRLRFRDAAPALGAALAALGPGDAVEGVAWTGGAEADVRVACAERALPALLRAAHGAAAEVVGIEMHRPTLEDVFFARTGRALREAAA